MELQRWHRFLLTVLVLFSVCVDNSQYGVEAVFVIPRSIAVGTTTTQKMNVPYQLPIAADRQNNPSRHILAAFGGGNRNKKKTPTSAPQTKQKKEQIVDPLKLIVIFLTPWKNPNSIFLYMLITLYVLGKMSESASSTIN